MADVPGGASGLLVRDYKGKEAHRLVTRIDPGVVSLVAELRRPRAPGGRGTVAVEDHPLPIGFWRRFHQPGLRAVVCSRLRGLQAAAIAREISSRNARVAGLQER
jgi:hypothetical protein